MAGTSGTIYIPGGGKAQMIKVVRGNGQNVMVGAPNLSYGSGKLATRPVSSTMPAPRGRALKATTVKREHSMIDSDKADNTAQSSSQYYTTNKDLAPSLPGTSGWQVTKTQFNKNKEDHQVPSTSSGRKHTMVQSSSNSSANKRRKTDRSGKGLRHFSMKVCEKVKDKGVTTYNEVADELVAEETGDPLETTSYDQKNIRRRVYDALNVLMAMNIISKDKKEIRWIGLPSHSLELCDSLEKDRKKRCERIELKQQQFKDLIMQQISFKSLIARNKMMEDRGLVPSPSSAIQLPFIICRSDMNTQINCSISDDKSEYQFKFNDKFEIHDDVEVLKRMGLLLGLDTGDCTYDVIERAKTMVPKAFHKYIELYGKGGVDVLAEDWETFDVTNDSGSVNHSDCYDLGEEEEEESDESDGD